MDLGRTSQDARESTELLASFYGRVGISLKAQYHNWPAFLRRVSERQSQMFRIGWVGDYPDAENFLQLFYGRNVSPGPNAAITLIRVLTSCTKPLARHKTRQRATVTGPRRKSWCAKIARGFSALQRPQP